MMEAQMTPADDTKTAFKLGQHEAALASVEKELHAMRAEMAEMRAMVTSMNDTISRTKGGWAVLSAAAGIASAVTMGFLKLVQFFKDAGL